GVGFGEREGSGKWFGGAYRDGGRINLKSGVAIGFNPTDFFKTRAVVEPLSIDPAVLREDRLGTVMLRGQFVWRHGSVSAAFAPRVASPPPLYTNTTLPRSEEHTSELQSLTNLVCRLLLEKKKIRKPAWSHLNRSEQLSAQRAL